MSGMGAIGSGSVSATYELLVAQSSQLQTALTTLTEQASTGLVSTTFGGLGAQAGTAIGLNAEVTQQQALITGITVSDTQASMTQTALSQIDAIAQSFVSQVGEVTDANPSSVTAVASAAQAALQQLTGILDTQSGGSYIFGGDEPGTAPVPNPDQILRSGFYTQIQAVVQGLNTNGATATIAATQSIAESNAAGTSPFSAYLSQPASQLQAGLTQVAIGNGQYVTTGVVASANTAATSSGPSTTGSYVRDLMRALATLGSMTSDQTTAGGFNGLLQDTLGTLQGVVGGVADEQAILGGRQNAIDQAGTLMTTLNTSLQSQIGSIQDVNVAAVSTQLSQTQASLEASYKMIANLGTETLLTYLPVG